MSFPLMSTVQPGDYFEYIIHGDRDRFRSQLQLALNLAKNFISHIDYFQSVSGHNMPICNPSTPSISYESSALKEI